jgi:hypothetical protein
MRLRRAIGAMAMMQLWSAGTAAAQEGAVTGSPPFLIEQALARTFDTAIEGSAEVGVQDPASAPQGDRRACDGCPPRSVGRALLQTTIVNGIYELANLARGQVTARITPETWWANMEQGWVWDLDDFAVNQIGHPYQGSNYFNTGRANGLSFWESAAVTAFGSATWEYYGETNHASLNDLINTTLGGIALGEMFHRAAWLIRDTRATGRGRMWREIGATAVDPITGVNRFLRGDASRVVDKPQDMVPSSLAAFLSAGVLWRGTESSAFQSSGKPFLEVDSLYGDYTSGRSRIPYDAFAVRLRFGGGSAFSEARVRGRLLGQTLRNGALQFNVLQSYDYQNNDVYQTGSQSFEAALTFGLSPSSRTRLQLLGWGGLTVLGAIDSLPLGLDEKPEEEEGSAGQGVSEGPRFYDYGPGSNFGATTTLARNGRPLAVLMYEGRHLYSLDGVRANHFLQRLRLDLLLPLRGPLGLGVSGEYFNRRTYYQDADRTVVGSHYPQVRTYFTWDPGATSDAASPLAPVRTPDASASSTASNVWFTAGATFSTLRGDCQTCEVESPYRHSGGFVADLGYRVNRRTDVGGEVFWMPVDTADGHSRTTHLDAVAQFRPWASQGFFLKGGAGVAFVRNWVDALGAGAINSKALSVVMGAGWAFRPEDRVGVQLFATQHAAALGDFQTATGEVPDVIGNYWSLGASLVVR